MTDVQKLKERTCKDVHSLLLSGNQAVTLRQLEKDYADFIGARIPFQEMGYINLESYLRNNPSYFKLYWTGPNLMVKHVTNADTAHIEQMLKRQKPKKKAPYRGRFGGGSRYPRPQYQPVPHHDTVRVTSILRGQIRGLLMEYGANGIHETNFDQAYNKRFGRLINYRRIGFANILELLKSMPDIVSIETDPSGVHRLFYKNSFIKRDLTPHHAETNPNLPPRFQRKALENASRSDYKNDGLEIGTEPESKENLDENEFDTSGVNPNVQREIQMLLAQQENGVWASRFQAEYKAEYQKEFDMRGQGYNSIINLMADLPHIVAIERANQRDWLLFDIRHYKDRKPPPRPKDKKQLIQQTKALRPPISEDLKETIRQVVAYHPKGVLLDELTTVFHQLAGFELFLGDLGYHDLEELIISLDDVIHMEYLEGQGKLILYPQCREAIPRRDKLKITGSSNQNTATPRRETPMDAVGPDAVYRLQSISDEHIKGNLNYVEVYVSVVINPGNFWLQLKGPDTSEALENLMDRLEDAYCDPFKALDYTMPDDLITMNQVCAAVYPPERDWHRCRVSGFKGMDFVQLYYVDYGSTHAVSRKAIKYLKWRDFELPAQAIPAKLSNIKPSGAEWTTDARNLMLRMVSNRPLIALVTDVALDGTLSVCLTDTSGDTDLHINDELVRSQLAEIDFSKAIELYMPPEVPQDAEQAECMENVPKKTDSAAESGTISDTFVRRLQYVQLTPEHALHIICYNNQPYVTSGEISSLLWPGKDMLRTMLRQKKLNPEKLVLPLEENTELFSEFYSNEVNGTFDSSGKPKTHVTIFELSRVEEILQAFTDPEPELTDAIKKQLASFDPQDPYWKDNDSDEDEEDDDDDDDDDHKLVAFGRETLELALQSLQLKRKRILQAMQKMNEDNTISLVEELQLVESQLQDFKNRLREFERLEKTEGQKLLKGMTEEEDLICTVVAEQSDAYIEKNTIAKVSTPEPGSPARPMAPLTSTPRTDVKTNPVAPMPTDLNTPQSTAAISISPDMLLNHTQVAPVSVPLGYSLMCPPGVTSPPQFPGHGVFDPNTALVSPGISLLDSQKLYLMSQFYAMEVAKNMQQLHLGSAPTVVYDQNSAYNPGYNLNPVVPTSGYNPTFIPNSTYSFHPSLHGTFQPCTPPGMMGLGGAALGRGAPLGMFSPLSAPPINTAAGEPSFMLLGKGRGAQIKHPMRPNKRL